MEGVEEGAAVEGVAAEGATEETAVEAGAARTVVVAVVAVAGEGAGPPVEGKGAEEATAQAARRLACAWYRAPHRLHGYWTVFNDVEHCSTTLNIVQRR